MLEEIVGVALIAGGLFLLVSARGKNAAVGYVRWRDRPTARMLGNRFTNGAILILVGVLIALS
jgi:hypothetical protein